MTSHALEMASESGEQPTTTADLNNFDFEGIRRWIRSVEPAPARKSVSKLIAIAKARGDSRSRNRSTDADTNGPFKGKNGRRKEESEVGRGGDGEAAKGKVSNLGSVSGWGQSRVDRQERATSEVVSKKLMTGSPALTNSLINPYPSSTIQLNSDYDDNDSDPELDPSESMSRFGTFDMKSLPIRPRSSP
jgi:hypothetical protein